MKIQYSKFLYRQTFVFPSASLHININLCLEPLVALFEYFADVLQRKKKWKNNSEDAQNGKFLNRIVLNIFEKKASTMKLLTMGH